MPVKDKGKTKQAAKVVRQLPMEWEDSQEPIPLANAFYFVYEKEQAVLYIGYVDPMITVKANRSDLTKVPVTLLNRFTLTPNAFLRLKDQVDEVFEGMKSKGVFNE